MRLECFELSDTVCRYTALLDRLDTVPMAELVMAIRRTSPGFTRGSSSFRGVTQHKSGAHSQTPAFESRLTCGDVCTCQFGAATLWLHGS